MSFDPANHIQDLQYFGEFGGVNPSISDSSTYTFLSAKTMSTPSRAMPKVIFTAPQPSNLYLGQAWRPWSAQKPQLSQPLEWAPSLLLYSSIVVKAITLSQVAPFTEAPMPFKELHPQVGHHQLCRHH